jgi:diacylglycerol O-acyltransferase
MGGAAGEYRFRHPEAAGTPAEQERRELYPPDPQRRGSGRMSALDGSFLRLETRSAHMHVGWSAVFAEPDAGERPTLEALRARVASRLDHVTWCRWRLEPAPLGLSEPRWVEDRDFDLKAHVQALSEPGERVSHQEFGELRDELLSEPMDLSRAMWQIFLIPRLEDGRLALIGKIHHSLVDGIAALQIVGLVADSLPGAGSAAPTAWQPAGDRGAVGWALAELTHTAGEGIRALRATAGAVAHPNATARKGLGGAGRVLGAAREDILRRAPASTLNVPIGPRRALVGYHAPRRDVRAARAGGGTINDIGLTVVAGALRALAERQGDSPRAPLKAMVPVSMRRAGETGPGNRFAMVAIELPVHLGSPPERLDWVRTHTRRLKDSGRAEGTDLLLRAATLIPTWLRSPVVRLMSSPRVFNLTVSQSPGPRDAVHFLGCEMDEVYSVVPIADQHALAIGMVRYRRELFFGCYADPDALPEIHELPALLEADMRELGATADVGRATVSG